MQVEEVTSDISHLTSYIAHACRLVLFEVQEARSVGAGIQVRGLSLVCTLSYDIGWSPLLRHLITLCTISNHIRHDGITESTLVLIHQNGLAAMMSQVIFQVATEIRWRKVNFNALLRIVLLNKLQGWNKVAVGTNQHNGISSIKYAV